MHSTGLTFIPEAKFIPKLSKLRFLPFLRTVSANETKVAFLCSNSAVYSVVQWACWISGQTGKHWQNWSEWMNE